MKSNGGIKKLTERVQLLGPGMWILSVQYFIVQIITARDWKIHYSIKHNTISDLGNTACGIYGNRYICSPLHNLMNASFITLGLLMAIGSILVYQEFKKTIINLLGFSFVLIGGIGTVLVGVFPENTILFLHLLGATLPFLIGNIGIVLLGTSLDIPKMLRFYTLFSGIVSLVALGFLVSGHYLGLGIGGMERITSYPQTIWLIVMGLYLTKRYILTRLAPSYKLSHT